ncbi:hypothetical protein STENM36S_07912 [Streptomyces tendae]
MRPVREGRRVVALGRREVQHGQAGVGEGGGGDGVGEDQRGCRVAEHELQAPARVLGIHRHVSGSGLQHAEQPHDQVAGARQGDGHQRLRAGAVLAQPVRHPVRPLVEFAVRQPPSARDHGHRFRHGRRPFLEPAGDRRVRRPGGRGTAAHPLPLGRGQHVHRADGPPGLGHQGVQHPLQAPGEGLRRGPVQGVRLVLQGQPQVGVGVGHDGHRVVGAAERRDAGDGDTRRVVGLAQADVVDRVGLEDDQGVEEGAGPHGPVDLGQPVVVVVEQRALPCLEPREQLGEGLAGRDPHPHGQGVDEQADHGLHVRHGRRPPGDRGTEHHVLAARQLSQEHRPGALHQGVEGDAEVGGAGREVEGELRGEGYVDMADVVHAGPGVLLPGEQRRLVEPGQFVGPGPGGRGAVLAFLPHQEVAVGADPGQGGGVAPGAVQPQQVLHQRRHRPAVEQHVVRGEDQDRALRAAAHQGAAQQRRGGGVEALDAVLGQQPLELLLAGPGQVQVAPGQYDVVEDQLREVPGAVGDEGGAQVGVPVEQCLPGGPHPLRVDGAGQVVGELHLVGVLGRLRHLGLEEQALLERGRGPHVRQGREACLPAFQVPLAHRGQQHVGRGQPAGVRAARVPRESGQRRLPQVGQLPDLLAGEHAGREPDTGGEPARLGDERVDLQGGHHRHVGVGDGDQLVHPRGLRETQPAQILRHVRAGRELAQVVEGDLPGRVPGEHRRRLLVQVTQQPMAHALVGDAQQLLLDRLHHLPGRRPARQRLLDIGVPDVETDREHAGEPADRAREVRARDHGLLTPVALQLHQQRRLVDPPVPPPTRHRQRQRAQQPVVHPATERRRHIGEECLGHGGGEADPDVVDGGDGVHGRVDGAGADQRVRPLHDRPPQLQLGDPLRRRRLLHQGVRPTAHGGADRGQFRDAVVADLLPGLGEVGQEDAPGHTVHDQVMQHDHQPATGWRVEPHEPRHHPRRRVQQTRRRVEFTLGPLVPGRIPGPVGLHPLDQRGHVDRTGSADLQAALHQPRTQQIVPVPHRRQRGHQPRPVDPRRQIHHRRHREPAVPTPQLQQIPRHRQQRHETDPAARQLLQGLGGSAAPGRHPGQFGDRPVLEDLARGHLHAPGTCPGDDLDGADAVTAHDEEVVVHTDPVHTQHLGEHSGQCLLGLRRRGSVGLVLEHRGGQRPAVELAVGGQGQPVQDHERGRHHVLGQPGRDEPAQLRHRHPRRQVDVQVADALGRAGVVADDAHGDDVSDQLPGAGVFVHGDHGLGDAGVGGEGRLHLARLDAQTADLHLTVAPADVLQAAVAVPAGQVAGAVHARARRAEEVRKEAFRRQSGASLVAAGDRTGDVQLADHARRHGRQPRSEHVGAHVAQGLSDRHAARGVPVLGRVHREGTGVEALGLAVAVDDPHTRKRLAGPLHQRGGQRLAREHEGLHAGGARNPVEDLGEHRRDRADHAAVPVVAFAQLQDVTDHLDAAAGGERRHDLEHRHVEVDRRTGQHLAARAHADDRRQPQHAVDHPVVGDGHALGDTGRARGVHHVREVVGAQDGLDGARFRAVQVQLVQQQHRHVVPGQLAAGPGVGEQEGGGGLAQDQAEAGAGEARVDRQVGGARLEDAEHRHDQIGGTRQRQTHQGLRAHSPSAQGARQPVGPLVQLPVGQAGRAAQDGRRVRVHRELLLEQFRDGQLGGRRGLPGEPGELFALPGEQHVGGAHRAGRVGHEVPQHPQEAGSEPLHRLPVEQVGGVLQDAAHAAVGGVDGEVELQVELGGVGGHRLQPSPHARQVQLQDVVALPGEHHLEQRVVGGGALRVEHFHQPLERRVLVVVGGQGPVRDPGERLGEGRVAGEVGAQHPGVDEEADEVEQRLVGAAGDGGAEGNVVPGAEPVQQHRERGLHDHGGGGPVLGGQAFGRLDQLRVDGEVHHVAAVADRRRAGPVGGQLELLRKAGQRLAPVVELLGEDAVRVVLVAEQLALPQRVVPVLDREFLPVRDVGGDACGVGGGQVPGEGLHRLAVGRDVVDVQHQQVGLGTGAHQYGPHRDLGREIEVVSADLGDHGIHPVGGGLDEGDVQAQSVRRDDVLARHPVLVDDEHGAQALVADHHVTQRRRERRHVEPSPQVQQERDVVRRRGSLEAVDEPEAPLREGQGDHVASTPRSVVLRLWSRPAGNLR